MNYAIIRLLHLFFSFQWRSQDLNLRWTREEHFSYFYFFFHFSSFSSSIGPLGGPPGRLGLCHYFSAFSPFKPLTSIGSYQEIALLKGTVKNINDIIMDKFTYQTTWNYRYETHCYNDKLWEGNLSSSIKFKLFLLLEISREFWICKKDDFCDG